MEPICKRSPKPRGQMSGKNHDRSSALIMPLLAIALSQYLSISLICAVIIGFVLGFGFLSPDLDLRQSLPSRRWGWLHPMWNLYRKNHKHRGRSHFPLWGSFERLLFLSLFIGPFAIVVGLQAPDDVMSIFRVWRLNDGLNICTAAFGGIELAALWHLCCDYVWPLNKW